MGKINEKKVEFNCDYCGEKSQIIQSEYNRREHHYCSKECKNKHHGILMSGENAPNWKGNSITFNCDYCQSETVQPEYQYNSSKNHYCSHRCMCKHRSILYKGENSFKWKGGVTNEYYLLVGTMRRVIQPWRNSSIQASNGKCVVTGEDFECVHHLYSLNFIIEKTFELTGIEEKDIFSDYTDEELSVLKDKCLELHYEYGLGVCLTKKIHKEFHMKYGYGDNSQEQFKEFCNEYSKSAV